MIKQKLVSLRDAIEKRVYRNRNNDADYLKDLKQQRKELTLKKAFDHNRDYTIMGLGLIGIYIIFTFYNLWVSEASVYFLLLSFIFEFVGIALLLPFYSTLRFFDYYYKTFYSILDLLHSEQKEKQDTYLESFQINYNNLRKRTKRQILSSKGNFLTYDYEMTRIIHEIDLFFDSTTKILFRNRIMNIPYLPEEEIEKLAAASMKSPHQQHLDNYEWDDYNPGSEEVSAYHEIKEINFTTLNDFMIIFGRFIIRAPRRKIINTVAIAELFKRWNLVVKDLEPEMFEESQNDVKRYYNKKQELQAHFISKLYEIFVIFLISILSGIILNKVF